MSYCTSCGKKLANNDAFCANCGAPRHSTDGGNQPQPVPATAKRSNPVAIVTSAIAIAVAVVCLWQFGPFTQGSNMDARNAEASNAPVEIKDSTATSANGTSAQNDWTSTVPKTSNFTTTQAIDTMGRTNGTANQPGGATSQPASSSLINLGSYDDYYDINIFISNFAEWEPFYKQFGPFNRKNPNYKQLVNWGMWHYAINNDGALESAGYQLPNAPTPAIAREVSGLDPSSWPRRMLTKYINYSIESYTGLQADLSGYNSGDGYYYEQDGYMYEGIYRGQAPLINIVALADSVQDAGNNLVNVQFTIYQALNSSAQTLADKTWYGMTRDQLVRAMGISRPSELSTTKGNATVLVIGRGSNRSFKLVSFQV